MAITTSIYLSPPDLLSIKLNPKPSSSLRFGPAKPSHSFASVTVSPLTKRTIFINNPFRQKATPIWRIHATATPAEAPPPLETAQQIVSAGDAGDDGVSTIISALLFVAFIGLTILTIGVVYIVVSDFLQKREKEKFEKEEEAAEKKKSGKKKKARARAGPRGFGQRLDEETGDLD